MAKKPITSNPPMPPLELVVSREDATTKIQGRIERGGELLAISVQSSERLEALRKDFKKWSDYNCELLRRLFTNDSLAEEYRRSSSIGAISFGMPSLGDQIRSTYNNINEKIHKLESIKERIELIPAPDEVVQPASQSSTKKMLINGNKAFIVHGHDEGARESVARFLEKLGIIPIILHEQASGGRTVIEKLEKNSDVDFAVVLLTPDDVGAVGTAKDTLKTRARQNVILELGYFVGKLGRNRVCALHKGSVELPSDYVGVVYVALDDAGAWRLLLAKELREAGFGVDLNQAL